MNLEFSTDTSPEQMELTLGALRFSYQRLIHDCETFTEYLREQLSHVESLQSHIPQDHPLPKVEAHGVATLHPEKEIAPAKQRGKVRGVAPIQAVPSVKQKQRNTSIKMVKFYERFTMLEAIAHVLNQNKGQSLDADTIVRELYGELKDEAFRVAKDRVTKSLSKGKKEGMWYRVPDQLGVYTASLER